jgi:hypothetical protein
MSHLSDLTSRADQFDRLRKILASITREARNRGAEEIVDMAAKADELVVGLLGQASD